MIARGVATTRLRAALVAAACLCVMLPAADGAAQLIDYLFESPDIEIKGANGGDLTGQAVAMADFNGDGRDDLIIGARQVDYAGRSNCGAVYIVIAGDGLPGYIPLALDRPHVKRIFGPSANAQLGRVLACGDVNNDGNDDIVCGLPALSPNGKFQAGEVHVIFGSPTPPDTIDLANAVGTSRILGGAVFDKLGSSVAVGDVNDDTFGDILAGAPFASPPGTSFAGKVFVVYGDVTLDAVIDVASPSSAVTQVFGQDDNDTFGTACYASDVTGDQIADIIAGAPEARPFGKASGGIAFVIPGDTTLPDTIPTAPPAANGIVEIMGEAAGSLLGSRFTAGDWNGDTRPDLIVAAPEFTALGRNQSGAVYVVQSPPTWPDTVDLAAPNISVTRIDGQAAGHSIGFAIDAADLNADGLADVLVGDPKATPNIGRAEAGQLFMVFGRPLPSGNIDLALEQSGITIVNGRTFDDHLGASVAGGELQMDGFGDVLIGADTANDSMTVDIGRAFVVVGDSTITPTAVQSFDALVFSDGVRLSWRLADDLDPAAMVVWRRSEDSSVQLPADRITRAGPGRYQLLDATTRPGNHYTYTVSVAGDDAQRLFTVSVSVPSRDRPVLHPAFPNPFRDGTTIGFDLPRQGNLRAGVFDVRGRLVAELADRGFAAGGGELFWNGRNRAGEKVPTGIYFLRVLFEGSQLQRKIVVIR